MPGFHGDAAGEADLKCHHRIAPAPRLLSLQDRLFHKLSAKYSEQLVLSDKEHSWVFFVCVCVWGGDFISISSAAWRLVFCAERRPIKKQEKKNLRKFI